MSPTSIDESLKERFTLLIRKNYFAKLVMPIVSWWVATGLEDFSSKIQSRFADLKENFNDEKNVQFDRKASPLSRVIQFNPVTLTEFHSIFLLTIICEGAASVVMILETLSISSSGVCL